MSNEICTITLDPVLEAEALALVKPIVCTVDGHIAIYVPGFEAFLTKMALLLLDNKYELVDTVLVVMDRWVVSSGVAFKLLTRLSPRKNQLRHWDHYNLKWHEAAMLRIYGQGGRSCQIAKL